MEESHRTNEALTNDLQKLTADWESLRDELLNKEDEWKEEEQVSIAIKMFVQGSGQYLRILSIVSYSKEACRNCIVFFFLKLAGDCVSPRSEHGFVWPGGGRVSILYVHEKSRYIREF